METLVGGYVDEVFRGVKSNILVNGVEVAETGYGKEGAQEVTEGEKVPISYYQIRFAGISANCEQNLNH